ncbi:hypothetical protein B0H14DRAFT_2976282 [Mycena olivaceomarginata]|nr:hypothetical protein B0H14DRAFT_2976282 [Mycena olivaceomarginata]
MFLRPLLLGLLKHELPSSRAPRSISLLPSSAMDSPHGLYPEREMNFDLGATDAKIYSVSVTEAVCHETRASTRISILDLPSLATWQLAAVVPRTVDDVHLLTLFLLYCAAFYISWPWCRFVWAKSCGSGRLCSTSATVAKTGAILQCEYLNLHMPIYLEKIRATQGLPIHS